MQCSCLQILQEAARVMNHQEFVLGSIGQTHIDLSARPASSNSCSSCPGSPFSRSRPARMRRERSAMSGYTRTSSDAFHAHSASSSSNSRRGCSPRDTCLRRRRWRRTRHKRGQSARRTPRWPPNSPRSTAPAEPARKRIFRAQQTRAHHLRLHDAQRIAQHALLLLVSPFQLLVVVAAIHLLAQRVIALCVAQRPRTLHRRLRRALLVASSSFLFRARDAVVHHRLEPACA